MWSGRSSFTSLVVGVFVVYVVHTCWVMYGIVYTRPCAGDANCIQPYLARRPKLQVRGRAGRCSGRRRGGAGAASLLRGSPGWAAAWVPLSAPGRPGWGC